MTQVKHIGFFEFKSDTSPDQIDQAFGVLAAMVGQVPGLLEVLHGPNSSEEGLDDGYTHCFLMTFDSPASRDGYLPHPVHEAAKAVVLPLLERVVVADLNL
jgi:hypothetical protein